MVTESEPHKTLIERLEASRGWVRQECEAATDPDMKARLSETLSTLDDAIEHLVMEGGK